jgi:hypothetical protein
MSQSLSSLHNPIQIKVSGVPMKRKSTLWDSSFKRFLKLSIFCSAQKIEAVGGWTGIFCCTYLMRQLKEDLRLKLASLHPDYKALIG